MNCIEKTRLQPFRKYAHGSSLHVSKKLAAFEVFFSLDTHFQ